MRKSLVIAAVLAAGGSAAGAGAAMNMLGSDTLFDVTTAAIAGCPGANGQIVYQGTGSGNGESAMINGTQNIAPMSRFMNNNLCSPVPVAKLQTASGLVIGLDGVALLGSAQSAGQTACDGTNTTTCNVEAVGAAFNTVVAGYTFSNWKDVLAVIYGGKSHSAALGGCNSAIRNAVANTWGNFFETGASCQTASNDGCTQLQHAYRRDDGSGTSDVFAQLIGLANSPSAAANFGFGTSPFCNVNEVNPTGATAAAPIVITTGIAHGLSTGQTVQVVGVGVDIAGNPIASGNVAANGTWVVTVTDAVTFSLNGSDGTVAGNGNKLGSFGMVLLPPPPGLHRANELVADFVPTSYRELDPIRRPCANNGAPSLLLEDVCGRDKNLGLVLPVVPTDFLPGHLADQFPGSTTNPQTHCAGGFNSGIRGPLFHDPTTGLNVNGNCPNGDHPHGGNLCTYPSAGGTNAQCLSAPTDHPFVFDTVNDLVPSPNQISGLVYNAHLLTSGISAYQKDSFVNPIVGAWYRIHQEHVIAGSGASIIGGANLNGGAGAAPVMANCQQVDATLQLGCLVQASPCSIAYAGKEALQWNGVGTSNNVAIKVNQVLPLVACIQSFAYNLSRKLYLNTIPGFATPPSSAPENALAQCEADPAHSPSIASILTSKNFVNFAGSTAPNSGNPFGEDYDEPMLCPTQETSDAGVVAANVVAFTGNVAPIPSVGTVCGNGIREAYEDCDDGTANATSPPATATTVPVNGGNGGSACTTTCRYPGAAPVQQTTPDPGTKDVGGAACGAGGGLADQGLNCHATGGTVAGKCQIIDPTHPATLTWTCLP
jgi:ABC-type phosphate transport system substrate-binding protein